MYVLEKFLEIREKLDRLGNSEAAHKNLIAALLVIAHVLFTKQTH